MDMVKARTRKLTVVNTRGVDALTPVLLVRDVIPRVLQHEIRLVDDCRRSGSAGIIACVR